MSQIDEDTSTPLPKLLTATQVATWLGLTRKALYTMVERAEIPPHAVVRFGKRLRFDEARLNTWVAEKRASSGVSR